VKPWAIVTAAILSMAVGGCNSSDADEYEPAVVPKSVAFEGTSDAKYVGDWKASDGTSELRLEKDGALKIKTTVSTQSGKSVNEVEGKWLAADGKLRFQYRDVTVEYGAELSGSTMTLLQPGGNVKTTYKKS
jgi:hypothetical protein